ncbi:hypothetical protein KCU88_g351, partial [Aureobasidium melanogenum]
MIALRYVEPSCLVAKTNSRSNSPTCASHPSDKRSAREGKENVRDHPPYLGQHHHPTKAKPKLQTHAQKKPKPLAASS